MVPRFGGKPRAGLPETPSEWQRYLRAKAIGWLARREHSSAELAAKLGRLTPEDTLVEAVLADLRSHDLLSDTRFVESFVRSRSARYGSARVAGDLRAKGVPFEQARDLIDSLKAVDLARAQALWERKFGVAAADSAARAKQMRFLQARGFPSEVIRRVVPRAVAEADLSD